MDRETRKRKVEDAEESEEEKMEKFFALIRSTREIHERITGCPLVRPKENGEKKKPANGWNFMGDDARLKTMINIHQGSLLPGPSKKKDDEIKEKYLMVDGQLKTVSIDQGSPDPGPSKKREEEGLDLNLKL